jgi:hypothetical protein
MLLAVDESIIALRILDNSGILENSENSEFGILEFSIARNSVCYKARLQREVDDDISHRRYTLDRRYTNFFVFYPLPLLGRAYTRLLCHELLKKNDGH